MKYTLFYIGRFFALFFSPFTRMWGGVMRTLNTGYYSTQMHNFGRNSVIDRPVTMIKGGEYISIGRNSFIGKNCVITAWDRCNEEIYSPCIIIGDNVVIGDDCHITAINKIIIEDGVLTGKKITITDNAHGLNLSMRELSIPPILRKVYSKGAVVIKKRVWIGDKAVICAGITVGEGAIIGANSVVTKDVPPNTVVAGAPAVIIRSCPDEV